MTDIVFAFEVHQPFRVRKDYFWEHNMFKRLSGDELFDYYFDTNLNREIFERASRKCYFPSNQIILEAIDESKREKKRVKVSFSLSGVFLEQCERFNKDVLNSFKQLASTNCVEFIGQTYFHSLCGLYPRKDEFIEQVELHKQTIRDLLGVQPTFFENTELLYNNNVAKNVQELGYLGIFTEGAERILGNRSPNYVYSAKDCSKIRILLRNYKLTDDIGFRFSSRWWNEWPLTADKYINWLSSTPGQCIVIFPDYETFGEHHWPETGIHEFLSHLLRLINEKPNLKMETPSEVVKKNNPQEEIDVPEFGTVSWADTERNASGWLGNTMQWAYYTSTRDIEPLVKESQDRGLLKMWRYFQISDHLYYMFASGGGPGEVHVYFSPFGSPVDAFVTSQGAIMDFEWRLKSVVVASNEPFKFHTGIGEENYTGFIALSLRGFMDCLSRVDLKSIEFHNARGDFEEWAATGLRDETLATEFKKNSKLKRSNLRKTLIDVVRNRLDEYVNFTCTNKR
ncbi:MAG: alpha-amylase [Thermoproteota archaeon]|nr:alpha-amylase [Thermoproteota archaeon]